MLGPAPRRHRRLFKVPPESAAGPDTRVGFAAPLSRAKGSLCGWRRPCSPRPRLPHLNRPWLKASAGSPGASPSSGSRSPVRTCPPSPQGSEEAEGLWRGGGWCGQLGVPPERGSRGLASCPQTLGWLHLRPRGRPSLLGLGEPRGVFFLLKSLPPAWQPPGKPRDAGT